MPHLLSLLFSLLTLVPLQAGGVLCSLFVAEHERFGINVSILGGKSIEDYDTRPLNLGWYIDYAARQQPARPEGVRYLQLLSSKTMPLDTGWLFPIVDANPGAIWVLGNEPDRWLLQDSRTPAEYAEFYHHAYHLIKQRDPTALIATAGIVQPTPIRLLYLDKVLEEYARRYSHAMPVDVWTFHVFTLREVRGEWGADIPPGMEAYAELGKRYTVFDHGRLDLFKQHVIDFRAWMAARGYRHTPLILSEYGILMPKEYGFEHAFVEQYMLESFDFLRAATDSRTGYPADGNHLVQAWGWFSLNEKEFDFDTFEGFNGHLYDHDSGVINELGLAFAAYTAPLVDTFVDVSVARVDVPNAGFIDTSRDSVPFTVTVQNLGNLDADTVRVSLWIHGNGGAPTRVAQTTLARAGARCAPTAPVVLTWDVGELSPRPVGAVRYSVRVELGPNQTDRRPDNNVHTADLVLLTPGQEVYRRHLPLLPVR